MGSTEGGTRGHTRGGHMGSRSIELEQTALTSPFMQTHWHAAEASSWMMANSTATARARMILMIAIPCLVVCCDFRSAARDEYPEPPCDATGARSTRRRDYSQRESARSALAPT